MAAGIQEVVSRYGRLIEPLVKEEFPEGRYPFLSEGARYQLASGGKRLRPALCLLACEGLGGSLDRALPFACASEILHNLFLLHDDIEDGDRKRRDRDTVWVKYGLPNAINIGDFLAAKAYSVILKSPVSKETLCRLLEVFTETYLITARGQALDINLRAGADLTLDRYFEIVSLKTARYLAYNLVGGAIAAGASTNIINRFWRLGRVLGPAFQIQDDLIDLTAGKGRGGVIGCDIQEGKPTLFLAFTLNHGISNADRDRLLGILAAPREETTAGDVSWVIETYRKAGALEFATQKAKQLAEEADEVVRGLPLSNVDILSEICRFVVERKV